MSLQKLSLCCHLDNILTDRQEQLSDLEQEFKAGFKLVADSAIFPSQGEINQYKITFSIHFMKFYKILKLVLAAYSLIAPDCQDIKFQDVPSIMKVIDNFDINYCRLMRPHSNPIPTL